MNPRVLPPLCANMAHWLSFSYSVFRFRETQGQRLGPDLAIPAKENSIVKYLKTLTKSEKKRREQDLNLREHKGSLALEASTCGLVLT